MKVLTVRTDGAQAELALYGNDALLATDVWLAERQLAESLHQHIDTLLAAHATHLQDLTGLVAYQGPGSFTGLRIGLSVVNALAYALEIPVVGLTGAGWQQRGLAKLQAGTSDTQVLPEYGAPVHITMPRR